MVRLLNEFFDKNGAVAEESVPFINRFAERSLSFVGFDSLYQYRHRQR